MFKFIVHLLQPVVLISIFFNTFSSGVLCATLPPFFFSFFKFLLVSNSVLAESVNRSAVLWVIICSWQVLTTLFHSTILIAGRVNQCNNSTPVCLGKEFTLWKMDMHEKDCLTMANGPIWLALIQIWSPEGNSDFWRLWQWLLKH